MICRYWSHNYGNCYPKDHSNRVCRNLGDLCGYSSVCEKYWGSVAMDVAAFGRLLLVLSAVLLIVGLLLIGLAKLGVGRLPGDFVYRRDGVTIYFPLATSILISIILSLILWLIFWVAARGR